MRALDNQKLLTKLSLPVALLLLMTVGIVAFAEHDLDTVAASTAEIVDVRAARRTFAPELGMAVNVVSILETNLIMEADEGKAREYETRYGTAKSDALGIMDRLAALADTPERRAADETMRRSITDYFTQTDPSVAFSRAGDKEAAFKVSAGDATKARAGMTRVVVEQIEATRRELTEARDAVVTQAERSQATLLIVSVVGLLGGSGFDARYCGSDRDASPRAHNCRHGPPRPGRPHG